MLSNGAKNALRALPNVDLVSRSRTSSDSLSHDPARSCGSVYIVERAPVGSCVARFELHGPSGGDIRREPVDPFRVNGRCSREEFD
jgi:hypothetical protein